MKCRDVDRLSTAYVDGELDDHRASALRGHLRTCADCRERVADEAALVEAADELDPIDPPAELWSAIEARIAAAEIADANRPTIWFWWQAVRERALPIAAGAACAAVLVIWLVRSGHDDVAPAAQREVASAADTAATGTAPEAAAVDFEAARRAEVERAEQRYQQVIADLRDLAEADDAGELPAELDQLAAQAARERRRLEASGSVDPAERADLFDIYRSEIALLRDVAIAGVTR